MCGGNKMRTTIQLSEDLRKKIKILASYRDVSYEQALEDLEEVFNSTVPFNSLDEFSKWFEGNLEKFDFKKIIKKEKHNYEVEDKEGKTKNIILELMAKDFIRHKHDTKKVDLIVSFYSDSEKIEKIPVVSLIRKPKSKEEMLKRYSTNHSILVIPKVLHDKIKKRCEGTGFSTTSDYATYVLRGVLSNLNNQKKEKKKEAFSREDEEKVKERLKALGYL